MLHQNQFEMFVSARKYPDCDICYFCLNQFWMSLTISGSLAAFPVPPMFSVALIFSLDIQWYQISKLHISQFFQNKATYLNFTPKRIQSGITEVSNQVGQGKNMCSSLSRMCVFLSAPKFYLLDINFRHLFSRFYCIKSDQMSKILKEAALSFTTLLC